MTSLIVLALTCLVVAQAYPNKEAFAGFAKRLPAANKLQLLEKLEEVMKGRVDKKEIPQVKPQPLEEGLKGSVDKKAVLQLKPQQLARAVARTVDGTGQQQTGPRCDQAYRHELALASISIANYMQFMEYIGIGWQGCSKAAGLELPLYTEEEWDDREDAIFFRITDSEIPLLEAVDIKVELLRDGKKRFDEGVEQGVVEQQCAENDGLIQHGTGGVVLTVYVESLLLENGELEKWIEDTFPIVIYRAWTDGTMLAIFQWIIQELADAEQAENSP